MSRAVVASALLAIVFGAAACDGGDSVTSIEQESGDLDLSQPVFDTWEEAALAEAERLNPGLTDTRVDRVEISPQDERVRIQASDGYCRVFGGKFHRNQGWQANDLGAC